MSYERGKNVCASWPYCSEPPASGKRFCETHQAVLNRVREGGAGRPAKIGKGTSAKSRQRAQPQREKYEAVILDALTSEGELSSKTLAALCGTDTTTAGGSFGRAKRSLIAKGTIECRREGPHRYYRLAQREAAA